MTAAPLSMGMERGRHSGQRVRSAVRLPPPPLSPSVCAVWCPRSRSSGRRGLTPNGQAGLASMAQFAVVLQGGELDLFRGGGLSTGTSMLPSSLPESQPGSDRSQTCCAGKNPNSRWLEAACHVAANMRYSRHQGRWGKTLGPSTFRRHVGG